MNYKALGFIAGAVVAGIAVFAFNTWRHVSDEDRLTAVIADHCLPFVQTGTAPFDGLGRGVGVYDGADLSPQIINGGSAILYDNRFVAQWGYNADAVTPVRMCLVRPNSAEDDGNGFYVATRPFVEKLDADVMTPNGLVMIEDVLDSLPNVLVWEKQDSDGDMGGLTIMMVASETNVGIVGVTSEPVE
ncbi:MAG: hypothetical protein ACSHW1_21120 [Yoonia sp.]|uniref:hypothetical protein n=1 Tax=Yoonia sp. TaxID=2212373 RepID=UPI003EF4B710